MIKIVLDISNLFMSFIKSLYLIYFASLNVGFLDAIVTAAQLNQIQKHLTVQEPPECGTDVIVHSPPCIEEKLHLRVNNNNPVPPTRLFVD
jgi:hypothetical protein